MTDYIKYFPKPFLDDLVQGRCVPMIGAGFSRNADIPTEESKESKREQEGHILNIK